mmetsp:Transcript_7081/g.18163  ORF Transcript_7081/g.18163 Transcript_7081/m.18163 type:complete len:1087 (+) Transcript_7081:3-3263(+)
MIGEVVHFPTPNSTLEASDFRTAPGGKGGNEAVACGRLGSPVYIVGRVGNDDFGRTLTKQLSECMDICDVAVDSDVSTGFALIVTAKDTLQKTNTICKGANASLCDHDLDAIARILKEHSDVQIMLLTLDAGDNDGLTIASVAALGHTAGALVILRASPLTEGVGIIPQLWKFAHIIILTETEAAIALAAITHSGRPNSPAGTQTPLRTLQECANAARTLLNHSTAAVAVIVSSAMGVCCRMNLARMEESKHDPMRRLAHDIDAKLDADDDYLLTMPSFRGPVVDVVGAVDALAGGIAAGLQHGVPLSHALVWGTACCDRSIGAPGAQDSMPTMDELCFFLETANVHVALDGSPCRGDIWPVHKPALPRGVRKLEEFLHAGKHQEFGSTLATLREAEIQERLGAMISVPLDFQGQTLLHLAVLYGDVEAVLQCLASGADFERIDNYGLTPFERCDVEMRSARKTARERFALVKFVLAVVRQVKSFLVGPLSDGETRHRFDAAMRELLNCGSALTPLLAEGWAYSVLSLMTLSITRTEHSCAVSMSGTHALSNFLLFQVLADAKRRPVAVRMMRDTILHSSGVTYAHGLAFSSCEKLIRTLVGPAVGGDAVGISSCSLDSEGSSVDDNVSTVETKKQTMSASERKYDTAWEYMRDCLLHCHDTDVHGRTPLHYAAMGQNEAMCSYLLRWGHDLYSRDMRGLTPLAHCKDLTFVDKIKKVVLVADAFVSVGHTVHADHVITLLVEEAKKTGLTLWWDKGAQGHGRGIRPGEPWTSEIENAMKRCKVLVVILTKKWINSVYCAGEARCALAYHKPIITIMPPVPPEERATLRDLPHEAALLKRALSQRQIVNCSEVSEATFVHTLPKVFQVIESLAPAFVHSNTFDQLETDQQISEIVMPPTALRWAPEKHVFMLCGTLAESRDASFARLLASKLISSGVPVSVGFKPPDSVKDPEYDKLLQKQLETCEYLVIVVGQSSDFDFLNFVASRACIAETKVLISPLNETAGSNVGFGYTAHLTSPSTFCFSDWMGTELGLTEMSPIFEELFEDFLFKLDALQKRHSPSYMTKGNSRIQFSQRRRMSLGSAHH